MRALAAAWLAEHPERPHAACLRIDAVAVVVDERDRLVALEQVEDVA
jgi:Holliday junction resolvase-like predicted endonuclease